MGSRTKRQCYLSIARHPVLSTLCDRSPLFYRWNDEIVLSAASSRAFRLHPILYLRPFSCGFSSRRSTICAPCADIFPGLLAQVPVEPGSDFLLGLASRFHRWALAVASSISAG